MAISQDNAPRIVQFIHPGLEPHPDEGDRQIKWNTGKHKRKFLVNSGRAVHYKKIKDTELVFWGEWEPQSKVYKKINNPLSSGPQYIYRPCYRIPFSYNGKRNTDPFIFNKFLYGVCQQYKSTKPTQLRYLQRGSVILFGSHVEQNFVIDTVFVVSDWIDHHNKSIMNDRRVPQIYKDVTLKPMYLSTCGGVPDCSSDKNKSFRLYFGATYDNPVDDMFSFFPCLLLKKGKNGFARPIITDPCFITNELTQGYKRSDQLCPALIHDFWQSIVDQIQKQGLWLGIYTHRP